MNYSKRMKPNYKKRLLLFITGGVLDWVSNRGNNRLGVVGGKTRTDKKFFPKKFRKL